MIGRIKEKSDFNQLFRKGRRSESVFFRIIYRPNQRTQNRIALVASSAVDKRAVVRNRLRRRAREWLRKNRRENPPFFDTALIFKKEAVGASRRQFYEELERGFRKIFG